MTRNSNRHYTFSFSNGETFTETARNSFGSFVNMMRRVDARFGDHAKLDADGNSGTVAGLTFTLMEVNKL